MKTKTLTATSASVQLMVTRLASPIPSSAADLGKGAGVEGHMRTGWPRLLIQMVPRRQNAPKNRGVTKVKTELWMFAERMPFDQHGRVQCRRIRLYQLGWMNVEYLHVQDFVQLRYNSPNFGLSLSPSNP